MVEFELKRHRLQREFTSLADDFAKQLSALGFGSRSLASNEVRGLSAICPNADPFDRMLAAQAINAGLTLITADRDLRNYAQLTTLW